MGYEVYREIKQLRDLEREEKEKWKNDLQNRLVAASIRDLYLAQEYLIKCLNAK